MVPNEELHILTIHFEQREDNLYIKGKMSGPQGVLNIEVPMYTRVVMGVVPEPQRVNRIDWVFNNNTIL